MAGGLLYCYIDLVIDTYYGLILGHIGHRVLDLQHWKVPDTTLYNNEVTYLKIDEDM